MFLNGHRQKLLANFPLNEGAGTTAYDRINGRNLTLTNGPTWGTGSVVLDGTDDYLVRSAVDLGLNGLTEFTLAFEIKSTDTSGRIIQKQIADGNNTFFARMIGTGQIEFCVGDASGNPTWSNNAGFDGNWHKVVFAWKRNAISAADAVIYIDGVAAAATYTANIYSSSFVMYEASNNLYIGTRPVTLSDFFSGELKNVKIFKRQLTAGQVAAL